MPHIFASSHRLGVNLNSRLNPRHSLRASLGLAIGGIAFVLSVSVSLIAVKFTSEQAKIDAGQSLAQLAYQMTDKLDRGMFERYRNIQMIATVDAIRDPRSSVSEQRRLLEKLQSTYPNYAWIGFANNQGIVQASTSGLSEGHNVSECTWFIKGQQATHVGDVPNAGSLVKFLPNLNPENPDQMSFVDIAVPVSNLRGTSRGVLGAYLSESWAKEVKNSLLPPLQSHKEEMLILKHNGRVLLGPPEFETKILNLASVKAAQSGRNGYLIETWPDGRTYLTGFAHSVGYGSYPGLGWLVLVRQETDIAFASVQNLQQQIWLWNALLGLLFVVLGWMVADRITQPIVAIAAAADQIHQGKTDTQIPVLRGQDEIANLSKSLSQLVSTLTQQEDKLKASNDQLQLELTERQRVEEFLRLSEEKFRQVAENIQEVFWMHSPDRKQLLYVSPAYEQIWGYTCESWYQEPDSWLQCLHPEDRERVIAALDKEILGTYDEEYRLLHPDGSIRWIRDRAFPIYNEQGEVYRIVGIAQDITDRKQAEVTAQALEQERELSELKSRFIAIASHEFRTPLTAIVMSAELLEKYNHKATDAQRYRHFQQIKSAVKRITQLLDDVLVVGRAEAGKLECQPVPVDLEQFCGNIVEELQLAVGEKHQLVFTSQGADVQAYLDENLLRHILTNLLSNAIKYSPPGSRVQFDLICNSSTATFQIQDQGIGIPPADQDKLFTSFYRCSNTGKVAGTGLGLTIVQEAVELHGGQVKVESQLGVGTTFTVTLPLHPSLRTA